MDKYALISYTQRIVTSTDGLYFLFEPAKFLKLLLMEDCVELNTFRPDPNAQIRNLRWWRERIMIMTENRYRLHHDLMIVLRKDPNAAGELDGFIFDSFLFYNITPEAVDRIKRLLNEEGRGMFKNYEQLMLQRQAVIKPYYVRLMEVEDADTERGIFIVRNFY